jgi:23S rRNA A1618 N6-methylase RlmF
MKKSLLKIISVVITVIAFAATASAQAFEGVIEFKKQTATDTTNYVYYVKNNNVKIDEIGSKSRKVEGTFLVNMDEKTMISLNHERKLYMTNTNPPTPVVKGTCVVKKGQNVKNLQGYKCVEYIVTNQEEGTIITYWLADGKFTFFEKMLRQLNRKDKSSVYFLQISDVKNMFPMLSIQTDLTGKEIGKLEVTKITKKEIDPSMYEIPKGYNKFEK